MKKLIGLSLLLGLCSCGGGGGGKGPSPSQEPRSEGTQALQSDECFETALGWMAHPPESKAALLKSIESAEMSSCGGFAEMGLYTDKVLSVHPELGQAL